MQQHWLAVIGTKRRTIKSTELEFAQHGGFVRAGLSDLPSLQFGDIVHVGMMLGKSVIVFGKFELQQLYVEQHCDPTKLPSSIIDRKTINGGHIIHRPNCVYIAGEGFQTLAPLPETARAITEQCPTRFWVAGIFDRMPWVRMKRMTQRGGLRLLDYPRMNSKAIASRAIAKRRYAYTHGQFYAEPSQNESNATGIVRVAFGYKESKTARRSKRLAETQRELRLKKPPTRRVRADG